MAGITITSVKVTGTPGTIACPPSNPNAKFTVTVTVVGQGGQTAGAYDVKLYDRDTRTRSNLLDQILTVAIPANFNFTKNHTFSLWCDDICEVNGALGNSREKKPELQAVVYYGNNLNKKSRAVSPIQCGGGEYKPKEHRHELRE